MKKIFSTFLIVILISCMFVTTPVFADNGVGTTGGTGTGVDTDAILNQINPNPNNLNNQTGILNMASTVIGIIQFISIVATVILIAVFGFQFIIGSAEQKSDYQKKFIPLIIGVVVVFAVSSIAKLLFTITSGMQ